MPATLRIPGTDIEIEVDLPKETWPGHVAVLSKSGAKEIADELDRVAGQRALRPDETYLRQLLREHHGV